MDKSVRSLLSITLIVAALFVAMDRIVQNAPLVDWWLPAALLLVAILMYVWDSSAARATNDADTESLVEPDQSSLDGYRQAVTAPAPLASIEPKILSQAESDHADIVQAYSEIRDTDVRSDGMASAATTDTQEAHAVKDMVENIMDVGAMGTYEEVDEIAGGPVDSRSQDHPRTSPPKAEPLVTTPSAVSKPAPAPAPKSRKSSKKDSSADGSEAVTGTQARSDEMASAATMDSPEARETETGIVENIMETGATGKPEEVDEIGGGPMPSLSKDKAVAAQPDDLTVIEGIGMKMAAALRAAGIDTFSRLSTTSEEDLRTAIAAAGMRFAPSVPTWPQQAVLAAKGDWDALKTYQATLKGGRKK